MYLFKTKTKHLYLSGKFESFVKFLVVFYQTDTNVLLI